MKLVLLILAASVGLMGCAAMQRSQAHDTEQLLAAAGFRMQLAETGEQQQQLAALPAYRLVNRGEADGVEYTYADPTNCRCVYVGGSKEYAAYQRLMTERIWADEDAVHRGRWGGPWFWR